MASSYLSTKNYREQGKLVSLADRFVNGGKDMLLSKSWTPLVVIARTTIISMMERIERGQLRVITKEDGIFTFGTPAIFNDEHPNPNKQQEPNPARDEIRAEITVLNDAFWVRMLLLADLGFSEAYMNGDIEVDDLDALFKVSSNPHLSHFCFSIANCNLIENPQLFIINRSSLNELSTGFAGKIFSTFNAIVNSRFANSLSNAISNISAHYDISNRMFESFLSADMTYSCAIWGPKEGGVEGDLIHVGDREFPPRDDVDELEVAQMRKLRTVIARARISKGDRVLEIGSGWGSFAIEAVRTTGCTVDTLTLSIEQKQLAEARIARAGLSEMITVHLLDYRALPESFDNAFDRVVSIEMIEAVGREFLPTYFEVVNRVLREDRGLAVVQVITMPEARFEDYGKSVDFIQKHIFPGGFLPSVTCLVDSLLQGTKGKLVVEQIENIGPHYARTLREWRRRFEATFEDEIVPALHEAYPELKSRKGIDTFKRKWIYYFVYCETGFSMRALGDHILTFTREVSLFARSATRFSPPI
ncbi:BQ5605_C009g05718 [Microbotryum silenes-dioicae]|uniref:BQ5605_C009g05718 protein n=1 Tax=Microbotryum silenes-dioicae TaxID=796604 RepID=A0A2X0N7P3_9BASI|nr:BQ5605_C009g05718 [Microbotryum silenes-dioicae]